MSFGTSGSRLAWNYVDLASLYALSFEKIRCTGFFPKGGEAARTLENSIVTINVFFLIKRIRYVRWMPWR